MLYTILNQLDIQEINNLIIISSLFFVDTNSALVVSMLRPDKNFVLDKSLINFKNTADTRKYSILKSVFLFDNFFKKVDKYTQKEKYIFFISLYMFICIHDRRGNCPRTHSLRTMGHLTIQLHFDFFIRQLLIPKVYCFYNIKKPLNVKFKKNLPMYNLFIDQAKLVVFNQRNFIYSHR